mmetsp:Transcript_47299/g.54626  ORF Transcript_47299/g.54626 Transcript_47299/m.54626 type:complete len:139 (-) Transcript_47299:128-544(-)
MIIDGKSIVFTLIIVLAAFFYGLKFIRRFALQIAQENHECVTAMDQQEEQQRLKKERAADQAADAAFAQVEPILKVEIPPSSSATTSTTTNINSQLNINSPAPAPAPARVSPSPLPSSDNRPQKKESSAIDENDDGVM